MVNVMCKLRIRYSWARYLAFPDDWAVVMHEVDELVGPGWPKYRERKWCICLKTLSSTKIWEGPFLQEKLGEKASKWEIGVGLDCGTGGRYAVPMTFIVYCENKVEYKKWGWRYVCHAREDDVLFFDNVIELLQWHQSYREPGGSEQSG